MVLQMVIWNCARVLHQGHTVRLISAVLCSFEPPPWSSDCSSKACITAPKLQLGHHHVKPLIVLSSQPSHLPAPPCLPSPPAITTTMLHLINKASNHHHRHRHFAPPSKQAPPPPTCHTVLRTITTAQHSTTNVMSSKHITTGCKRPTQPGRALPARASLKADRFPPEPQAPGSHQCRPLPIISSIDRPTYLIVTSWLPRPRPRGSCTPLPARRNASPFMVQGGTTTSAMPSIVGTVSVLCTTQQHAARRGRGAGGR